MTPAGQGVSRSVIPAWKWWIVVLLLLATVVNYMDRQTIGSVASFIKKDFQLKEEGYGTLEAWFGYSYAVFLLVAGFLADRWDLRWLYAGALLVWSGAGVATGFVSTLLQLQICRAVLGAGEAFNWPVAVGVIRRIIPRESQAFANGVFNSGVSFGAVLTPLLVIGMVDHDGHGWRALFKVVGFAGLVVVALWLWGTRGARAAEMSLRTQEKNVKENVTAPAVPFRAVFTMRTFWITMAMGVAANMAWAFYRVWLPRHLVVDLKFTDKQLQVLLIAFYLTADLGSIVIGFLARKLVGPGRSVEKARKIVAIMSALVCLSATPLVFQPGRLVMVPLYCLVGAGIMGAFAMFYSFVQDIVPGHTSKCLGTIGATVWFISSKLHPLVGRFADTHSPAIGKFAPMLLAAGALPLLAALFALTWPEKREPAREPSLGQNV
jgi:ACS family hexuronate transporter-like MFS transporter